MFEADFTEEEFEAGVEFEFFGFWFVFGLRGWFGFGDWCDGGDFFFGFDSFCFDFLGFGGFGDFAVFERILVEVVNFLVDGCFVFGEVFVAEVLVEFGEGFFGAVAEGLFEFGFVFWIGVVVFEVLIKDFGDFGEFFGFVLILFVEVGFFLGGDLVLDDEAIFGEVVFDLFRWELAFFEFFVDFLPDFFFVIFFGGLAVAAECVADAAGDFAFVLAHGFLGFFEFSDFFFQLKVNIFAAGIALFVVCVDFLSVLRGIEGSIFLTEAVEGFDEFFAMHFVGFEVASFCFEIGGLAGESDHIVLIFLDGNFAGCGVYEVFWVVVFDEGFVCFGADCVV